MKRNIWKIGIPVIIIAILFVCCVIYFDRLLDDSVPLDKIISYVNSNYEFLETFPYEEYSAINTNPEYNSETKRQKERDIVKKHLGTSTIVKSVCAYNQDILQFYCGGRGMLDVGMYTGFYFSRWDVPHTFEFGQIELTELEPDTFEWYDEKGEKKEHKGHSLYTKKIRDNWWYYEKNWY